MCRAVLPRQFFVSKNSFTFSALYNCSIYFTKNSTLSNAPVLAAECNAVLSSASLWKGENCRITEEEEETEREEDEDREGEEGGEAEEEEEKDRGGREGERRERRKEDALYKAETCRTVLPSSSVASKLHPNSSSLYALSKSSFSHREMHIKLY